MNVLAVDPEVIGCCVADSPGPAYFQNTPPHTTAPAVSVTFSVQPAFAVTEALLPEAFETNASIRTPSAGVLAPRYRRPDRDVGCDRSENHGLSAACLDYR